MVYTSSFLSTLSLHVQLAQEQQTSAECCKRTELANNEVLSPIWKN